LAAWILQSLSNGYATFYGGVVIGLWILYCRAPHLAAGAIGVA
jgi:hypothetical protein